MPRRNVLLLLAVGVASLICYHKVQPNRYGRAFASAAMQCRPPGFTMTISL